MLSVLMVSSLAGIPLTEEAIDRLVSTRVVVAERKVRIDLSVRTGDPLGSREEGTLKIIAEPCLVTAHKHAAMFLAGGKQEDNPFGIQFKTTPQIRLDGKIQLDCDITETVRGVERGESVKVRPMTVLTPGKRVKVRVSSRAATDQTWIELEAKVVEPDGKPAK